jgi:hypothetical protein
MKTWQKIILACGFSRHTFVTAVEVETLAVGEEKTDG